MVIKEVIEAAAKGVYAEHTQLSDIIREVQQENAHLKEKKARAEEKIKELKGEVATAHSEAACWQKEARNTTSVCDRLTEENQALRQRNAILEAAMAGFGAILRGVRP